MPRLWLAYRGQWTVQVSLCPTNLAASFQWWPASLARSSEKNKHLFQGKTVKASIRRSGTFFFPHCTRVASSRSVRSLVYVETSPKMSLFGNLGGANTGASATSTLFGGAAAAQPAQQQQQQPATGGGLFGGGGATTTTGNTTTGGGLFGNAATGNTGTTNTGGGLFGNTQAQPQQTTSAFGSLLGGGGAGQTQQTQTAKPSLFGGLGTANSTAQPATTTSATSGGLFGSLLGNNANKPGMDCCGSKQSPFQDATD